MSRNYRGGGGGGQRGWGNDGGGSGRGGGRGGGQQPASTFAFGNQQQQGGNWGQRAPPSPSPQWSTYQQTPQRRGGFGGTCYACGQPGHVEANCPQHASGSRGRGGDGGRPLVRGQCSDTGRVPTAGARPAPVDIRRAVGDDLLTEAPAWAATCYAPDFAAAGASGPRHAGANLIAGDVSFEEARAAAYAAVATGGPAAGAAASRQLVEVMHVRQAEQQRLASATNADLQRLLQAASGGQPLQGALPSLSYAFPAGGSPWGPQAPSSTLASVASVAMQPVSSVEAVTMRPSSSSHVVSLFPSTTLPQPQPQEFTVRPPITPAPAPRTSAAAELPPASDEECWQASAFRQGHIPESAPPAQYV